MRLAGRNALITGAGSGIGQSMAELFAQEGANVAVNALTEERTEETLRLIEKFGRKTVGIGADVTDFEAVAAMIDEVIQQFGRLDTLVCNAGIAPAVELAAMSEKEWDRMIRVHLYGTFNCCRSAINHMISNGFGRIIITSSSAGIRGDAMLVH
jgi:3-oxoacyl-[acyl-carrier protein] reductase